MENIKSNSYCPFCNPEPGREIILESKTAFAVYDKFPVSSGHTLIIPKRHCADYFELSFAEQSDSLLLLNSVKEIILNKFNPDGFNIGININESAGQTIAHVHIHLIPRYKGDMEDPRGGVRHSVSGKGYY